MSLRRFLIASVILVSLCIHSYGIANESGEVKRGEDEIEALRAEIEETRDDREKAVVYKKIGEAYVSRDDLGSAADNFMKALSLYKGFSEKEKIRMAVYISWADRLDDSITILESILSENPENVEARIDLARVLSWSGRLNEAIEEANMALDMSPEDRDALLVKANSLSWRGSHKEAIPIYRRLLEEREEFNARLGLAHALLAMGDKKGARQSFLLLKPVYPYQERELEKLKESMDSAARPGFNLRYSYYNDTDDNRLHRYSFDYGFWRSNWKMNLGFIHTDAKDNSRDNRVESFFFDVYTRFPEHSGLGVGGGAGLNLLDNSGTSNLVTGHLKADTNIMESTVSVKIEKRLLSETAQLIENGVRYTGYGVSVSRGLTDRVFVYSSYDYRDYSDDNSSSDFQLTPRYVAKVRGPRVTLGYRFRYLDFDRQSGSGYFDPENFVSHQVFATLFIEKEKFYAHIDPYAGHQSFSRNGTSTDDLFGGGFLVLGYKPRRDVTIELSGEGSNYAVGTAAGFRYYMVGLRLLYVPL